jgi:hypothetical protein
VARVVLRGEAGPVEAAAGEAEGALAGVEEGGGVREAGAGEGGAVRAAAAIVVAEGRRQEFVRALRRLDRWPWGAGEGKAVEL